MLPISDCFENRLSPGNIPAGVTAWILQIATKLRRMPLIATNGLLVLIPSALFLASKARAAEFDSVFHSVQALELAAGAANISLLGLKMRDGLRMKGWLRRRPA